VRQINPRHHNVLEAEIKPGQHQSQILHHGTGLLLDGVRQFAGRIGLSGDEKTASTAVLQLCVTAGCLRTFAVK